MTRKLPILVGTARRAVRNLALLRYVGKFHVACLQAMFFRGRLAMPSVGYENVRHATLLFCTSSDRLYNNPSYGGNGLGLRLCCSEGLR